MGVLRRRKENDKVFQWHDTAQIKSETMVFQKGKCLVKSVVFQKGKCLVKSVVFQNGKC